ncbi:hypothetical protein KEJ21_01600 [Candidatus Bathyarchaeota archaeon]|nr:hypothetical protein [Candidatus Bathyarchaeota archaeon]
MGERIIEQYLKDRLPREDDKQLFDELYKIFREGGQEALVKHLKNIISQLER